MTVQDLARDTADDPRPERSGRSADGPARWWREARPVLLRVHFYAGIFAAPFILVAAVTGLLYTLSPWLDEVAYHDQLHPLRVGGAVVALPEQIIAATRAVPADNTFSAVIVPEAADETTRVVFADPRLHDDRERTVFVDPYSGQVRGTLVTWFDYTPVMTWLDDLHRNLHLGDVGRSYSEVAASWLWILALSGVVLWAVRRRRRRRELLTPVASGPARRRLLSWHGAVGVWALVGLLFLSATGLSWSRFAGDNFAGVLTALHARTPELDTTLPTPDPGDPRADAGQATRPAAPPAATAASPEQADTVLRTARAAGLLGPIKVSAPTEPGHAWSVEQRDDLWPIRQDRAAIDPNTGVVTARANFADRPLLSKLTKFGVLAHMGLLFGWFSRVALAALAIGLICLIVWGYRLWWRRRPTRPIGAPGAGQPPTLPALFVAGVAAIALGLAIPLLGLSLLVFLLLDAVLTRPRRTSGVAEE
jgi:uncharacterized iron-regulated membrane protein